MISESDILLLHKLCVADFGGSMELRDRNLLLSAISRPFQTFDGSELYKTAIEKAAALGESLIINHPFVDGNKRTAMLAMLSLLNEYDIYVTAGSDELYQTIISMASGDKRFDEIVTWLTNNTE